MRKPLRALENPPVFPLIAPLARFARLESSSSIVLLLAAGIGLALANSPFAAAYEGLLKAPLFASTSEPWNVRDCVNNALMAFFFLVVGLEVKRELLTGELAAARRALLPILAALGGVITPAGLYLLLNYRHGAAIGWGVPIATDVAFSLAVLGLFARTAPPGLKAFLVTLAIVDDLVGVLVIAVAYTRQLHPGYLALSLSIFLFCLLLNWQGVTRLSIFMLSGVALWWTVRASGLHPTLAGALLSATIPAGSLISKKNAQARGAVRGKQLLTSTLRRLSGITRPSIGRNIEFSQSPLTRLEGTLHPWVSFGIVPLFAMANADVPLRAIPTRELSHPVLLGVLVGLLIGKPLGITLFSWIAVRLRLAALPQKITWAQLHAVAWLGGIGFTISILIAGLAFGPTEQYTIARIGILGASLLAAAIGASLLFFALRSHRQGSKPQRSGRTRPQQTSRP